MIPLQTSLRWSNVIATELLPLCTRLEIAGSIRRQRSQVGDIDIVCIPKTDAQNDLLGAPTTLRNQVVEWAERYVATSAGRVPSPTENQTRIISQGEMSLILQLRKCQLDLWFATDATWSTRLLCRTGSKDHNIWFADRCAQRALHWFPYWGIAPLGALRDKGISTTCKDAGRRASDAGCLLPAGAESDLYSYVGLEFIDPQNRELPWLIKNIDSGL